MIKVGQTGRDRVLQILACLFAALEIVAFAVNFRAPVGPPILVTLPVLGTYGVAVAALCRAWFACTHPDARRFWRAVALASIVTFVTLVLDIQAYVAGPVQPMNLFRTVYAAPLLIIMWALYRLPLGARTRGERQRLLLDIGTVTLAVVLFTWYFAGTRTHGTAANNALMMAILAMVLMAIITFGLVKVTMSGSQAVDQRSLRLFSAGFMVELAGTLTAPILADRPQVTIEVVTRALFFATVVFSATRQRQVSAGAGAGAAGADDADRRPFSFLPYLAVAGVDALLLVTLWRSDPAQLIVGIVAVALTGLVIARQLGAFRDNARLLGELGRQERRFRSLVQNAADVIAISDRNGIISYVSPGVQGLTGHAPDELIGTTGPTAHPDDRPTAERGFSTVSAEPGATHTYQIRVAHVDGSWRWVKVTLTNRLDDPAVGGIVTNSSDITETHAYHAQLAHQASHDSLTDLANRSLFDEQLRLALDRADDGHLSLVLIDLDDFKPVNDTLGHQAGDALLIAVAERLRRGVRPKDLVGRLGGDEFAVILTGADPAQVDAIIDRMQNILAEPLTIDSQAVRVQASIGIATARPGDDPDQLTRRADLALYEAKRAGKGRYVRYAGH